MTIPIFDKDHQPEGWMHDFLALCEKGHKRNFVWCDDNKDKLVTVHSRCVICDKQTTFTVKEYWQEPCLESDWKGVR